MIEHKWKMQNRIFIMIITLIFIVFVLVFIAFNFFINEYIQTNAKSQLELFTTNHNEKENVDWQDTAKQPKNKVGAYVEAFVIDDNYVILHEYNNNTQAVAIADYLSENNTTLSTITNMRISVDDSVFYLTAQADEKHNGSNIIFYADTTTISNFADTINIILIVVVIVAIALSFGIAVIISRSITKPVKHISDFAEQIGKSNFETNAYDFKDKEFIALSESMNKTAKQLAIYDTNQKTFFQNVSHELKTPLMSIKLNAEGINEKIMAPDKSSNIIISEADRLNELVEDLLFISSIDNITQRDPMEVNDIRDTFSLCAVNQKSIADKKNIRFVYDFQEEPVMLLYSEKHMYRALYNLISNAIQFAKSTIALTCKIEKNVAILTVSDDGSGISSNDLPYIFDRFYKGENGNNGIGLSIVKSVIDLHQGIVSVACTDHTTFKIEIPLN